MATELVVGCPVRRRHWIIQDWFDHVEKAVVDLGLEPVYAFVADVNDPTMRIVRRRCEEDGRQLLFADSGDDGPDERRWSQARYGRMVELRNRLLGLVRPLEPQCFLSVDSDILLHPQAFVGLLEGLERFGAVGGAAFMTESGTHAPNCGSLSGREGLRRRTMEHVGVVPMQVIMALKLMAPAAYAVDYELHTQGEDVGWSAACARAGVRLGWDNRFPSKHVMSPERLGEYDPRCGW